MAENQKEVHPKCGRTAGLCVEEMRAGETVEQEHDLSGSERADGDEHHAAHDQVNPCEEGHFCQRHAFATHAEDRREDVGGGGNGSEAADHYTQDPIISTVPFGKRFSGEWSISEPAHIRSAPRSSHSFTTNETEVEQQTAEYT